MDDGWDALEHYLLARTGGAPEPPHLEPVEPLVVLIPTLDADDVPPPPTVTLGAPPAGG